MSRYVFQDKCSWDFPGGPVVQTPPSNAELPGLVPGQGAKLPHASGTKKKKERNINRSNIVTDLIICVCIYRERARETERQSSKASVAETRPLFTSAKYKGEDRVWGKVKKTLLIALQAKGATVG